MKKIFCPKCDTAIPLRRERIEELQASGEDRLSIICPQCTHQLNLRLRLPSAKSTKRQEQRTSVGHIIVVENVFGYKQLFPLYVGVNAIGRRNKDTATDIPVITSDPSMDRHHAIIKVTEGRTGKLRFAVADDDSRVGTFLAGELLAPKEWRYLQPGDVLPPSSSATNLTPKIPPSRSRSLRLPSPLAGPASYAHRSRRGGRFFTSA